LPAALRILEALRAANCTLTVWHNVAPPSFVRTPDKAQRQTFDPISDDAEYRHLDERCVPQAAAGFQTLAPVDFDACE
jgi:hypothetical protein